MNAVLTTTRDLASEDGSPLGWEYDFSAGAAQSEAPGVRFHSQWARLVYEAAFHPKEVRAAVCKHCGRPMLNQPGGKARQFCCPSCKTAHCVAHKAGGGD